MRNCRNFGVFLNPEFGQFPKNPTPSARFFPSRVCFFQEMERRGYLIRVNFLVFLTIRESMFLGSEFHVLGGQILGGVCQKTQKNDPPGAKKYSPGVVLD